MPALAYLGHDAVLQVVARLAVLTLGLLQGARGQHLLEALGALTALGGMRLVNDHGEALAWEVADLPGDHREFLQCADDDVLAILQRLLELARGALDVFHRPSHLLECQHVAL